jgi:pimeloyl-ACP methyl ester carboxylesterase
MSVKPVFVLVPGAWHLASTFNRITSRLRALSYTCITYDHKAISEDPPVASIDVDIAGVRARVVEQLDRGHNVVVVGHSWGGIVTSGALEGLGKLERGAKESGVVKIVYLCAFVPHENKSVMDIFKGTRDDDHILDVSDSATTGVIISATEQR